MWLRRFKFKLNPEPTFLKIAQAGGPIKCSALVYSATASPYQRWIFFYQAFISEGKIP